MVESLEDVRSLLRKVRAEILRREEIKKNVRVLSTLHSLRSIRDRLEEIESILAISKYDFVFIGQVGVGKTTTICHLLDLLIPETKKKAGKTIEVVKEVLSTGSGKTTICEVVIKPAATTFIEIEPYPAARVEQELDEFSAYIWQKVYPPKDQDAASIAVPPAELLRAIRNMVDLKEVTEDKVLIDKAIVFAEHFPEKNEKAFKASIREKARLDARVGTRIDYSQADCFGQEDPENLAERIWLKQTFGDLNLVKLENFSIPQRITLNLSPKILDFSRYPYLNSIIDTRGMDVVKDRSDLEVYIDKSDDAICLFTDRFTAAPTNTAELIGRYLTPESKHMDTKLALLVLPRKNEPESLVGSDGPVEIWEDGIARRKSDIDAAFVGQQIPFLPENVLFYDPLLYYLSDGRLDQTFSVEDIVRQREQIFSQFKALIQARVEQLLKQATEYEQFFLTIISSEELSPEEEKKITQLEAIIYEVATLENIDKRLTAVLMRYLKNIGHGRLRGLTNRCGIYPERDIDLYFDTKSDAKDLATKNLQSPKSKIEGAVSILQKAASDMSGLDAAMAVLKDQIDASYLEIVSELTDKVQYYLKDETFAPLSRENEFWEAAQDRWGQGTGYTGDVLDMYLRKIDELDSFFELELQSLWQENFIKKMLAFFGHMEEPTE